eukprot:1023928_1
MFSQSHHHLSFYKINPEKGYGLLGIKLISDEDRERGQETVVVLLNDLGGAAGHLFASGVVLRLVHLLINSQRLQLLLDLSYLGGCIGTNIENHCQRKSWEKHDSRFGW